MKNDNGRKLSLHKETLRQLGSDELRRVGGRAGGTYATCVYPDRTSSNRGGTACETGIAIDRSSSFDGQC